MLTTHATAALIELSRLLPADAQPTIFQILTILGNPEWRGKVVPLLSQPRRQFFTDRFPLLAEDAITPVTNLIDRLRSSTPLAALLEQTAKYGIRGFLLNQNPERLTAETLNALTTNRSHLISTALNAHAAALIAREWNADPPASALTSLPRYTFLAQATSHGELTRPFLFHGVPVTTTQLHALYTPGARPRWTRRVLSLLARRGLVERFQSPGTLSHWFLTEAGADTWRHEIAHPISPVRGRKPAELLVADALLTYLQTSSDGSIVLHQRFIELDRGTARPAEQLASKIARYARLRHYTPAVASASGGEPRWRRHYRSWPPLLIVLADQSPERIRARVQRTIALAQSDPGNDGQAVEFPIYFVALDELLAHGPFAQIFITAANPDRRVDWLGET